MMLRRGVLLCSALWAGCGPQSGTDVGNGFAAFDAEGYESAVAGTTGTSQQALSLSSGVELSQVLIAMSKVRIQPGTDCDEDDRDVDVQGPLVADLVGGGIIGGPREFDITPGPFCELRVEYQPINEDQAPPGTPTELIDLSLYVSGTRADGTPFTVSSEVNDKLEVKTKDGKLALGEGANALFLAYELGSWVSALELDTLGAGPVTVSKDDNPDALSRFDDAVSKSARVFRDENGNGALDPPESAPGKELADTN